ncbi:hypothetical protein M758_9G179900 [Ceratodon purpureus]|nr:hypothetical protein M758_9G179900 [Ceratodon purpureus]
MVDTPTELFHNTSNINHILTVHETLGRYLLDTLFVEVVGWECGVFIAYCKVPNRNWSPSIFPSSLITRHNRSSNIDFSIRKLPNPLLLLSRFPLPSHP